MKLEKASDQTDLLLNWKYQAQRLRTNISLKRKNDISKEEVSSKFITKYRYKPSNLHFNSLVSKLRCSR